MIKLFFLSFFAIFLNGSVLADDEPFIHEWSDETDVVDLGLEDEKPNSTKTLERETKSEKIINTSVEESPFLKIALIVILFLLFISLVSNYTLLRWRARYKNQLISFPESLQDQFESLSKEFSAIKTSVKSEFAGYSNNLTKQINLNQDVAQNVSSKYAEIYDSFSSLQQSLDKKDQEIDRLKKGYDLQVIKKYIVKLIRILDICDEIKQDPKASDTTKKEISFIFDSLENLLEDSGIEKYAIDKGVSTKSGEFGIPPANEWVQIKTVNNEQILTVKETVKEGYYINAEVKEVLKFAKIEVYVKGESNE